MKKLSDTKIGEEVTIDSLSNDESFLKFMEMGLVPGEKLKLIQIAPMGDPITIFVSGTTLSLRLSEADNILVYNT